MVVNPLDLTGFPLPPVRLIGAKAGLAPEPTVVGPRHLPAWPQVAQEHEWLLGPWCPQRHHARRIPACVLENLSARLPALPRLADLLPDARPQAGFTSVGIAEAVAAAGRDTEHPVPTIPCQAIHQTGDGEELVGDHDDLQVGRHLSSHAGQHLLDAALILALSQGDVLRPEVPGQRQAAPQY